MEYGELGHQVAADYRMNIVADWDSPILAYKANKDRYVAPHRYAGAPHLGSSHGEDAIVWNVFRGFQKAGQLDVLARHVGISEPRALLIWGLACGTVCALLAIAPALHARGMSVPVAMIGLILLGVLIVGAIAFFLFKKH